MIEDKIFGGHFEYVFAFVYSILGGLASEVGRPKAIKLWKKTKLSLRFEAPSKSSNPPTLHNKTHFPKYIGLI